LHDTQAEWQVVLDRQFVLRAVASLPWARFGYYSRPAALGVATGPFGIGYEGAKTDLRHAWIWMNTNAAEVSLRNFSDAEVPVTLEFEAVAGPGVAGVDMTISCERAACAPQPPVLSGPPPWHLRVPLKLLLGTSAIRFTATAAQAAPAGKQDAVPIAGIGHLHLIWSDR
jgi:hypothetical protein